MLQRYGRGVEMIWVTPVERDTIHNPTPPIPMYPYRIPGYATHSETRETLVIHEVICDPNDGKARKVFARPLDMFMSKGGMVPLLSPNTQHLAKEQRKRTVPSWRTEKLPEFVSTMKVARFPGQSTYSVSSNSNVQASGYPSSDFQPRNKIHYAKGIFE